MRDMGSAPCNRANLFNHGSLKEQGAMDSNTKCLEGVEKD